MNEIASIWLSRQDYYSTLSFSLLKDEAKADRVMSELRLRLLEMPTSEVQDLLVRGQVEAFLEREVRSASVNYMNPLTSYLQKNRTYFEKLARAILRNEEKGKDVISDRLEQFIEMPEVRVHEVMAKYPVDAFVATAVKRRCLEMLRAEKVRNIDANDPDPQTRHDKLTKLIRITAELHPGDSPPLEVSESLVRCAMHVPFCMAKLEKTSPVQWLATKHYLLLEDELGREPTIQEQMARTGFSASKTSSSVFLGKRTLRKCLVTHAGTNPFAK